MNNHCIAEREFEKLGLRSDALLTTARRHEATLHKINVEPLQSIPMITKEYLHWFDHLFLLTFFYDYCLDRANEEQYPEAFFISANMYCEYRNYIEECFGDAGLNILDERNAYQVYYQLLEKQWENPAEYHRIHPNYSEYYKKQVLCMTHVELLGLASETKELSVKAVEFYKNYWSLVLLIDDIMDVDRDIESKTLTPIIANYYAEHGTMPNSNQADYLRRKWFPEIERLLPEFERSLFEFDVYDFLYILGDLKDKLYEML